MLVSKKHIVETMPFQRKLVKTRKEPDYAGAEHFILSRLEKELSPLLSYHGIHHTKDVMNAVTVIGHAEKITEEDIQLLKVAATFHDAGFIYIYKGHEEKGCAIAKETLPGFGFSTSQIKKICGMIMATKIPQSPRNKLEEIIGDADLDYLGRNDVDEVADSLFSEVKAYTGLESEKQWNEIQVGFLKNHTYHTGFSKQFRAPGKQAYLDKLLLNT